MVVFLYWSLEQSTMRRDILLLSTITLKEGKRIQVPGALQVFIVSVS